MGGVHAVSVQCFKAFNVQKWEIGKQSVINSNQQTEMDHGLGVSFLCFKTFDIQWLDFFLTAQKSNVSEQFCQLKPEIILMWGRYPLFPEHYILIKTVVEPMAQINIV